MTATMQYAANLKTIEAARVRIADHAHRTPVFRSRAIDDIYARRIHFKCELFQRVGAFKFRGAMNAIACRRAQGPVKAIVTHSSGNHAQAVALAAKIHGYPAHIVMPTNAPEIKRQAVRGYGATIHPCAPTLDARMEVAESVRASVDGVLIHPYDDPDVIAGQGTIGLELAEDIPELDAVMAPVGGGGLLSGITLAMREKRPGCPVFAAEPFNADDAFRSKAAGHRIPVTSPDTIADGLRTSLGAHTWPVVRDLVPAIIRVSESEIISAMRLIWERMKLVIEPSAAVGLAALGRPEFDPEMRYKNVAVILCGGNLDLDNLPWKNTRQRSN